MAKAHQRPQPEFTDQEQRLLEIEDMRLAVKFGDKKRYSAKAAKKAAAVAKPKPAPPPATPAPLRDQVRASLLRRGA